MKKTTISILITAGVLVLAGCSLFGSKVPQVFIDKHNETVALGKEAQQLSDLTTMPEWSALDKQMSDGNYTDALKTVEIALNRKKDASSKLDSTDKKLTELKLILGEITDSKIKAGAENFIGISEKENSAKISYNNLQIQLVEKMKTMISILEKNPKTISAADEKTVNDLIKQIDALKSQITEAEKEMNTVQNQYKETEKEFFGLAGLEIAK